MENKSEMKNTHSELIERVNMKRKERKQNQQKELNESAKIFDPISPNKANNDKPPLQTYYPEQYGNKLEEIEVTTKKTKEELHIFITEFKKKEKKAYDILYGLNKQFAEIKGEIKEINNTLSNPQTQETPTPEEPEEEPEEEKEDKQTLIKGLSEVETLVYHQMVQGIWKGVNHYPQYNRGKLQRAITKLQDKDLIEKKIGSKKYDIKD